MPIKVLAIGDVGNVVRTLQKYSKKLKIRLINPIKFAEWWDNLFEKVFEEYGTIRKNSSPFKVKLRMIGFLLGNRIYAFKIMNFILRRQHKYEGQTLYNS